MREFFNKAGTTRSFIAIILFSLLVFTAGCVVQSPSLNDASNNGSPQPTTISHGEVSGILSHTVTLDKPVPGKVDKIMVYKTIPPNFTRQDIITYGEKFNMSSDDDIKGGDEGYGRASKDRKIHLYITNTGWIEYSNSNRAHSPNPFDVPENLPSDAQAVEIATKFLKDQDLLPESAEFRKTSHGRILQAAENGTAIVVWEDIQVWYGRKLDGKTVEGTQLMLALGADGTPIEFFTNWRDYQPYEELSIKSPDQSLEELKKKGVPVGMNNPDSLVSIDDMFLAYHTTAGAYREVYLEPVWVFKGNVIVDGKPLMPVEQYIPALTDASVRSITAELVQS